MDMPVAIAVVLLAVVGLTALITLVLARVFSSSFQLGLLAGLFLPTLGCLYVLFDLATLEVDSPPPGALLIGVVTLLLIVTPFSLLTGFCVARFRKRRDGS